MKEGQRVADGLATNAVDLRLSAGIIHALSTHEEMADLLQGGSLENHRSQVSRKESKELNRTVTQYAIGH